MKTFKQLCFALTFGMSAAALVVLVIYLVELI